MPLAGPVFQRAGVSAPVRLSLGLGGLDANNASTNASFSPDGRTILFESLATNLVRGDANGSWDIFTEDLASGLITRISTSASGGQASGSSNDAQFDAGGTRVVFDSTAPDLVSSGATSGTREVFIKDLVSGAVTLVSSAPTGTAGNADSLNGTIAPDGRRVAFDSLATNFVGADTNHARDIYVKSLDTGTIIRASTDASGGEANGQSADAAWSPDGTRLLFESNAGNLVPGDTNGVYDIFLKNPVTGAITRVSTAADGTQANGHSFHAHFTADGHSVTFESLATNLVPGGTNGARDIFQKNLDTGVVTLLSTDIAGAQATGNSYAATQGGGFTAFESNADLTGGGVIGHRDVYLRDSNGAELRVSLGAGGAEGNANIYHPQLAADGTAVLFHSTASNIVGGDNNSALDIFLAKLLPSTTSGSVTEGGAPATGSLYFDDGNAAATHTVRVTAPADAIGGLTATLATDATGAGAGRIDWRFTGNDFDPLAPGQTKTETFGVIVTDAAGHSATQPVTITLTGASDPPVATDTSVEVTAGATTPELTALLLGNDHPADADDTIAIAAIDTGGTLGSVTLDPVTHALTYAASASAFQNIRAGLSVTDHFGYTIIDQSGETAHAIVTVTVNGIAAPSAANGASPIVAAPGGVAARWHRQLRYAARRHWRRYADRRRRGDLSVRRRRRRCVPCQQPCRCRRRSQGCWPFGARFDDQHDPARQHRGPASRRRQSRWHRQWSRQSHRRH